MALPETNNLVNLINQERLSHYDTKLKAYITKQLTTAAGETDTKISDAIAALGNIITIKGVKDSTADLPAEGAKAGDLWFVKQTDKGDASGTGDFYEEYVYTGSSWEYVGKTSASLEGYLTEADVFKGTEGTGTEAAPADGTVLAKFLTNTTIATAAADASAAKTKSTANETAIGNIETYLGAATIASEESINEMFPET